MRKGGEEERSVRAVCDVCAAHGERTAVGLDFDTHDSSLRKDERRPFSLVLALLIPIGASDIGPGKTI